MVEKGRGGEGKI